MKRLSAISLLIVLSAVLFACSSRTASVSVAGRPVPAPPDTLPAPDTLALARDTLEAADSVVAETQPEAAPADTTAAADSLLVEKAKADSAAALDSIRAALDSIAARRQAELADSLEAERAAQQERAAADTVAPAPNPRALHFNGIYLNSGVIGNTFLVEKYIEKAKKYGLCGFVMDMKDDRGYLTWHSKNPVALKVGSGTGRVEDPAALVKLIHDNGLVACARVVTFKDPLLSRYSENGAYPYAVLDSLTGYPWEQDNGETWANMMDPGVYAYLTGIISELVGFGFDQIQLDYIRFPSDGPTGRCYYPVAIDTLNKVQIIGLFLSKVREVLDTSGVSLSVDVFGWVPWLPFEKSQWIGQDYDEIARWSDVICPMFYSSHFPAEFKQEFGPLRAYNIILEGTRKALERRGSRNTAVQPYIQSFNYKSPFYGEDYILQQIQAANEGGAVGWIAWNARSDYSMLWKALDKLANFSRSKVESQ